MRPRPAPVPDIRSIRFSYVDRDSLVMFASSSPGRAHNLVTTLFVLVLREDIPLAYSVYFGLVRTTGSGAGRANIVYPYVLYQGLRVGQGSFREGAVERRRD